MIRKLHHNAYRCRDSEQTRRFYEEFLGLPLSGTLEIHENTTTSSAFSFTACGNEVSLPGLTSSATFSRTASAPCCGTPPAWPWAREPHIHRHTRPCSTPVRPRARCAGSLPQCAKTGPPAIHIRRWHHGAAR